ncbi:MAG: hypothetical protein KDD66_09045 [Bdellovibrionales bacterium]|nr:hypothetical protein [Bdellovibrionales bacterium]
MEHATPGVMILMLVFIGPVLWFIRKATRGEAIYVRRIPGIDAIDDAVGRAVELGRPMSFTSGLAGISPVLYACLGVLRHVARKAAVFGSRFLVPSIDPEAMVLADATLQNAYRTERKYSSYDPTSVRFLSTDQFAFASGYMGLIHREKVAGAFLFGTFAAESLILAEAGQQVGAIQVAATVSNEQIPFFITTCDYTLIGEELYAAGAFLSKDPVQVGSLKGQDYAKIVILILIIIGVAQATYYAAIGEAYQSVTGDSSVPLADWIKMSFEQFVNLIYG